MHKLTDVISNGILTENALDIIPELRALKACAENNDWHAHETVYDHTVKVLELLGLRPLPAGLPNPSRLTFRPSNNYSMHQLLLMAALLHDVGKPRCLLFDETTKTTTCDCHELGSADISKSILERFDFTEKEKQLIYLLIVNHGQLHFLINPNMLRRETEVAILRLKTQEIFFELLLLAYAETELSALFKTDPTLFQFKISAYNEMIGSFSF